VVFKQSPGKLINNYVNAFLLDRGRKIWIATNNGVSSFSGGVWGSLRDSLWSPPFGSQYRVACIVEGKDGSLWFGLTGGGIVRYNPFSTIQVWRRYYNELPNSFMLAGAADVSNQSTYGEVWFTTVLGISRFIGGANELGTWVNYSMGNPPALPSNQVPSCINKLDDNTIWFGTQTGGSVVASYGLSGLQWTPHALNPDSRINSISFDLNNTVWFGIQNGAVTFNVSTSVWTPYPDTTANHLPPGPVNAIATDLHKVRWFGTNAGLVRLSDTTWTRFTAANSPLPSDTVNALMYDSHQNLWVGTINGVAVYNDAGIQF
jgi:ligand-binding sensor domain-containing protein